MCFAYPGVVLRGAGCDETRISAESGAAIIVKNGTIENLAVDVPRAAGAVVGILATGSGAVTLRNVCVNAEAGMGIVADSTEEAPTSLDEYRSRREESKGGGF